MRMVTVAAMSIVVTLGGCAGGTGLYGGTSGGGGGADQPAGDGLMNLPAIDFGTDVEHGEDPASVSRGGGTVRFSGGTAGTLGIIPLYFDDSFAWELEAGGTSTVEFIDLDVRTVQVYFAHDGDVSATLTAEDAEGNAIESIESFPAATLGDANARARIEADGASVARLVIEVPQDAVVALDHLVLSIPESEEM